MSFWRPIVVISCAVYHSKTHEYDWPWFPRWPKQSLFSEQLLLLNMGGTTSWLIIECYVKSTRGWWLQEKNRKEKSRFKVLISLSTICNGIAFACQHHLQNHPGNMLFALPKRTVQCMQNWGEQLGKCLFTLSPALLREWPFQHL